MQKRSEQYRLAKVMKRLRRASQNRKPPLETQVYYQNAHNKRKFAALLLSNVSETSLHVNGMHVFLGMHF